MTSDLSLEKEESELLEGSDTGGVAMAALPSFRWAIIIFFLSSALVLAIGVTLQALSLVIGLIITEIVCIGAPVAIVALYKMFDLRRTFSLNAPRVHAVALAPIVGVSAWLLASQGTFWLLDAFGQDVRSIPSMQPLSVGFILAMTLLPGPCEELLFRGFILRGLLRRYGPMTAVVLTAFLFGLFHMDPTRLPGSFFLGLVFGVVLIRTGSLYCAIIAHVTNNLCATTLFSIDWCTYGIPLWQLAIAAGVLLLSLWLSGLGERPQLEQALSQPKPVRRAVVVYALTVILGASLVIGGIPWLLEGLSYVEPIKNNGTVQLDRYRLGDNFSYRKESTVLLYGEPLKQWGEQGYHLRLAPGERLVSVRSGGDDIQHTGTEGGEVALAFKSPPVDFSRLEIVCAGRAERVRGDVYYFPALAYLPLIGHRTTVDLRDAPRLKFSDNPFRVVTRMYITWREPEGWLWTKNQFGVRIGNR